MHTEETETTEAPPAITPHILTGKSGTRYRAVDLFNEMDGDHEEALTTVLTPILPSLMSAFSMLKDGQNTQMGIDVAAMGAALVAHRIHRHALALLFLPEDDREFRIEDVAERERDLSKLTLAGVVSALKGFFSGVSGSFQSTFGGSLGAMLNREPLTQSESTLPGKRGKTAKT